MSETQGEQAALQLHTATTPVGKPTREERKKEVESFFLESFLKLKGWPYRFDPLPAEDGPDFLLHAADGPVGLEVTQLFKDEGASGSPLKREEKRRTHFLQRLASAYYEQGGLPLDVGAILPNSRIADPWIPKLAKRLRMARPKSPGGRRRFKIDLDRNAIATLFVHALPDELGNYCRWRCVSDAVGWVGRITDEMLMGRIEEKAGKLAQYRKAASRTMLLIYVEHTANSGMLDYAPGPMLLPGHGFSQVHLLIYPLQTCQVA